MKMLLWYYIYFGCCAHENSPDVARSLYMYISIFYGCEQQSAYYYIFSLCVIGNSANALSW